MDIKESEGYKKLLAAAEADEKKSPGFHDYFAKVEWVVERANHYAEKTGMTPAAVIDGWEAHRSYWYMSYYQDANQPLLEGDSVRVFEDTDDLRTAVGEAGFRCPRCGGVSSSAYECDSGKPMNKKGEICNWKVFGLFRDLGAGVYVYVKDQARGQQIFMPVAWEQVAQEA